MRYFFKGLKKGCFFRVSWNQNFGLELILGFVQNIELSLYNFYHYWAKSCINFARNLVGSKVSICIKPNYFITILLFRYLQSITFLIIIGHKTIIIIILKCLFYSFLFFGNKQSKNILKIFCLNKIPILTSTQFLKT